MTENAKKKISLYLVATPIGNLSDMSSRALDILSQADFIAAEDTRKTGLLLSNLGIKKPLISYYEHNMMQRGLVILDRLRAGEVCALVTDAGMPGISDPGEMIVSQCLENGFKVSAVPGPCAFVCALAMSGLSTKRFAFEGFLNSNRISRRKRLEEIKDERRTLIFYEAPHKLKATLDDMFSVLGDREISLVREISKIYEETLKGTIGEAVEYYREKDPLGEFVLIIEGAEEKTPEVDSDGLSEEFGKLILDGMTKSEAAKLLAQKYGLAKREIYDIFK